jgi:hypothetical protein
MYINNYFNTTIWSEQKPEFIKSLTKHLINILKMQETKKLKLLLKSLAILEDHIIQHHSQWIIILETLEITLVKSLGNI